MIAGAATQLAARLALVATVGVAATARAQDECRPSKRSNEAKLLAFYSVPITFSTQVTTAPSGRGRESFSLGADIAYVPKPDPDLRVTTECFLPKDHTTHLSSVFPRPRVLLRLPFDLLVEASYLPPVRIANARAHVFSVAAASKAGIVPIGSDTLVLGARVHGTVGTIRGAITCSEAALRPNDPADPCFGSRPSEDTFHPNTFGFEATLAHRFGDRGEAYVGGGTTWLRPRFQVGFRDGFGGFEDTRLIVDLRRINVLGGGALRLADRWLLTGQIHSSPQDVTVGRLGIVWEPSRGREMSDRDRAR